MVLYSNVNRILAVPRFLKSSLSAARCFHTTIMGSNRRKVFVTRSDIPEAGMNLLRSECDVEIWALPSPAPREELLRCVAGKDALFCTLCDKIDADLLDKAGPSLKVISTMSVGYDHVDVKSCKERNIRIGYTPEILTDATAELTIALLLATTRRIVEANKEVYNGGWKSWAPTWMCGMGLKRSIVGIVGFGRIGREVAKRILPFKPSRILYTCRTERKIEAAEVGAEFVSFEDLIRTSDIVIALCALTAETKNLFNENVFEKMKSSAMFINASRGAVVDQKALYDALKGGKILSAGLDVTTPEPLPLNDPLLTLQNIVILPHIGSADYSTRIEMSRIAAQNLVQGLMGDRMVFEV